MSSIVNTAEGTASGTTVTAANSGGASGTALDVSISGTSATLTFSNAQSANGSQSYLTTAAGSNSTFIMFRNAGGTANTLTFPALTMYSVCYFFFAGTPPTIGRMMEYVNSAFSHIGGVGVSAAQKLTLVNSAGTVTNTGTTTLPANKWFRIEMKVFSDATVGQITARIFLNNNSTVADETITSAASVNTRGGNIAAAIYGFPTTTATSVSLYMDGPGVSDADWMGPAVYSGITGLSTIQGISTLTA
jgi:hypothetical protein